MSFLPGVQRLITDALGITFDGSSAQASNSNNHSHNSASSSANSRNTGYEPSALDVVVVKFMLIKGCKLPHEIVLSLLDHAEYWPHTSTTLDHSLTVSSGGGHEDQFVLRSRPLGFIRNVHYDDHYYSFTTAQPKPFSQGGECSLQQLQDWIGSPTGTLEHPCRKVVFTIRSRDQGWGGGHQDRGSYRGSWTWFEVGKERFDKNATHPKNTPEKEAPMEGAAASEKKEEAGSSSAPGPRDEIPTPYFPVYAARSFYPALQPGQEAFKHELHSSPQWTIQRNKTAHPQVTTHKVVWSWNDDVDPLGSEKLEELGRGPETGNGDFVRNLTLGDVVTVWAKARFPGWTNHVESVSVDVYWAL